MPRPSYYRSNKPTYYSDFKLDVTNLKNAKTQTEKSRLEPVKIVKDVGTQTQRINPLLRDISPSRFSGATSSSDTPQSIAKEMFRSQPISLNTLD